MREALSTSPGSPRGIGLHRRLPDLGRCSRIAPPKCAIEIGKVTETYIKRHRADVAIGKPWVAQDAVCARETLAKHKRREGEALILEELAPPVDCFIKPS
jgi:hypothetical protein